MADSGKTSDKVEKRFADMQWNPLQRTSPSRVHVRIQC